MQRKLSKSKYVAGLNCPKVLWLQANQPELAAETDAGTERVFSVGHRVGEYAQKLFSDGVLIEEDHTELDAAIEKTKQLAQKGVPSMFEATVEHENVLVRADILERVEGEKNLWDMYEVKSTTKVKEQHCPDVAIQKYCFDGAGFPIRRVFLTHINNQYVRRGEVQPEKLLVHEDITESIDEELSVINKNVKRLLEALNGENCPDLAAGPQCSSPYACAFFDHCNTPNEPYSIYELSYANRVTPRLEAMGITLLKDIPEDFELNQRNAGFVESLKTNEPVIDRDAIGEHLSSLEWPLHFLDFETVSSAVPLFDESRPYQNVPFQYSLHIQKEPGGPCEHRSFLLKDKRDPRQELIKSMLEGIGPSGSIVVYNMTFEKGRIEELARDFPAYSDRLQDLIPRLWDLLVPFRSGHYVHYDFHGSASLKSVLPVLVPSLSYKDLEIQNGGDASLLATLWYDNDLSEEEWEKVYDNLLEYCHLDTLATVEILGKLQKIIKG